MNLGGLIKNSTGIGSLTAFVLCLFEWVIYSLDTKSKILSYVDDTAVFYTADSWNS